MASYDLEERDLGDPHVVLLEVAGELDLTNAHTFEEQLEDRLTGERVVLLDLDRLLFLDSAGVHALFRIARRLGPGRFGLVLSPNAAVSRTIAIVGLASAVTVGETPEEVLAGLAPHAS